MYELMYIYIYLIYINISYIYIYDIYIYIWYIYIWYIYIYDIYIWYIYIWHIWNIYIYNMYDMYVYKCLSIYLYIYIFFPFIFPVNTLGPWPIRPMRRDFPQRFACSEDPAVRCVQSSSETLRQRRPNETSQALGKCQQCHWGHNICYIWNVVYIYINMYIYVLNNIYIYIDITSIYLYIYMVYGVDIIKYVWYMVYLGHAIPVN